MPNCVSPVVRQALRLVHDLNGSQSAASQPGGISRLRVASRYSMRRDEAVIDSFGRPHAAFIHHFRAEIPEVLEPFHVNAVDVVLVWQHCYVGIEPDVRQFLGQKFAEANSLLLRCRGKHSVVVDSCQAHCSHPSAQAMQKAAKDLDESVKVPLWPTLAVGALFAERDAHVPRAW